MYWSMTPTASVQVLYKHDSESNLHVFAVYTTYIIYLYGYTYKYIIHTHFIIVHILCICYQTGANRINGH